MATYQWVNRDTFSLDELVMYGSSRLGTLGANIVLSDTALRDSAYFATHDTSTNPFTDSVTYFAAGLKQYEFTNHLGNVLLTLTDRHTPFYLYGVSYLPEIASAQDYYPFGMLMPGRTFVGNNYRYGYNGQEKDDEVQGAGNTMAADFWEYDSRLGRRWNIDPIVKPDQSPYLCFNGNPIFYHDLSGQDGEGPNGECPGDQCSDPDGHTEKYTEKGWQETCKPADMSTSEDAKKFIKAYDPLGTPKANQKDANGTVTVTCPFNDATHNATIGYGHLMHTGPVQGTESPQYDNGETPKQADEGLNNDIKTLAENPVKKEFKNTPLTQNEFDALVIKKFNGPIGETLIQKVKAGQIDAKTITATFLLYTWSKDGKTGKMVQLPGLVTRQKETADIFLYGIYNSKH